MAIDGHVGSGLAPGSFHTGTNMLGCNQKTCAGGCTDDAVVAFESALSAAQSLGQVGLDLKKRFDFLYDVCGTDRHKEAEIRRENTIALYEALYGQEDPRVAAALLELAALYAAHGNLALADYVSGWANEILCAPKDEPQHEFFHLVGYDKAHDEMVDTVEVEIVQSVDARDASPEASSSS